MQEKDFISINKLHFIKKEYKIQKSLHNSIELKFGHALVNLTHKVRIPTF